MSVWKSSFWAILLMFLVLPQGGFAHAQKLSTLLPTQENSWSFLEANSDKNNPLYIGAKPRDMALWQQSEPRPRLPVQTKHLLNAQVRILIEHYQLKDAEIEAWPLENDEGDYTWAYARYRNLRGQQPGAWIWLRAKELEQKWSGISPLPEVPVTKNLSSPDSFQDVFADFLEMSDLYQKPLFGNSIFTDKQGNVLAAWLPSSWRQTYRNKFTKINNLRTGIVARVVSQPARFNDQPLTFLLRIRNGKLVVPSEISFYQPLRANGKSGLPIRLDGLHFDSEWSKQYQWQVEICAGEREALFPISGKRLWFTTKNNAQKGNHLYDQEARRDSERIDMATYLKEKYSEMGLKTWEQKFNWREMTHSNLIAFIPGSLPGSSNKPVILADHFDTAFEEDTFRRTKQRVSAKGADDNCTATAGLLSAAAVLKDSKPLHDIWFVHLTGEEFPADDLGVRQLLPYLLEKKVDLQAFIILDMIGFNPERGRIFQISAGEGQDSLNLAKLAEEVSLKMAPHRSAKLRERFDSKSYLYNTDGRVVNAIGYPVVLFNEHVNRHHGIDRKGYHDTHDTTNFIDWNYATDILKIAIVTVQSLGSQK